MKYIISLLKLFLVGFVFSAILIVGILGYGFSDVNGKFILNFAGYISIILDGLIFVYYCHIAKKFCSDF